MNYSDEEGYHIDIIYNPSQFLPGELIELDIDDYVTWEDSPRTCPSNP